MCSTSSYNDCNELSARISLENKVIYPNMEGEPNMEERDNFYVPSLSFCKEINQL